MHESERQLMRNIQAHDLAESLRQRRARLAREAGLPVEAFALPFPGNHQVTIQHGDGLAARIATGLVGMGLGLGLLLASQRPRLEPVEMEIKIWNEGGDWKWQATPLPAQNR